MQNKVKERKPSHGKSIFCLDSSRCILQEFISFAVLSHRTAQGHWQHNLYANGLPLCLMSANTNFVYVNDGQPWCAHTDRCIHKHTQTHWTLSVSVWSNANALGRWHTALVSSWVWLRQGHMFVDKGWSGRDADLLLRVQRSWLTPCLCSGGNHLINLQSPVMRDCMILTGADNENIRFHLNNYVCSLISVQNVHLLENFITVEVMKYWMLKIQSN